VTYTGSTGDAVAREAAWLAASGDGLPALQAADGGPFDIVQPYWPRTAPTNKRALYLVRATIRDQRTANIRTMATYSFVAKLLWPMLSSSGSAEAEQQTFDDAVALLLTRINAPMLDKTHGGRFLSVGENPAYVEVVFDDPERLLAEGRVLRAEVRYSADDFEINN
jgi:hypothetical protein